MLELDEAFLKWWLVYVKRLIFHINFVDRSVETLLACVHGLVLWLFSTAWTKKFCLSRYRNLKVFPLDTFSFDTNFTFSIFVWPWNENTRTKQKQQMNENRAIWLVYRTDTNARSFWSVLRTFGWKNVMPENFVEINRYLTLTSYCNTIGQSNNAFSILGFSLAGKRRVHFLIFSSIGW